VNNEFVPGTRVRDGDNCPCCGQLVKLYRRTLPNATARVMIAVWFLNEGRDYLYMPELLDQVGLTRTGQQGGYCTYGHYWKLMKQQPGIRDDGSNRVGWWKLTDLGRRFVLCQATVPKYAHIYNSRCFGFSGPDWTIQHALGTKFNYSQLMAGHWPPPPRKRIIPRQ
jgi:hypothetical protein